MNSEAEQAIQDAVDNPAAVVEPDCEVSIVDDAPLHLDRPLRLIDGKAYAATWLHLRSTIRRSYDEKSKDYVEHDPPLVQTEKALVVVDGDGTLYSDAALPQNVGPVRSLGDLGVEVRLREAPRESRLWSGAGVKRYVAGDRPDPSVVFTKIADIIDHFMDFNRSLADQQTMSKMVACYVIGTYMLDAFNVIGYLWPNGDKGSGKTHLLATTSELAYLGEMILSGGSFAALRDMADHGATLAFDDVEHIMDAKRGDPDKQALLLAGNRKGVTVPLKEPDGKRGWVTRHVNAYCPRLFSAIRLPNDTLGSRTIILPLIRSDDDRKASSDPLDHDSWPHDRGRLIDDLWATALAHLPEVRRYYKEAAKCAPVTGRSLDPWRGIFAVALWLETEHGPGGLFQQMLDLFHAYQTERSDLEATDPMRIAIKALERMMDRQDAVLAETAVLARTMNEIAREAEIVGVDDDFTNSKKAGWLLQRLRFKKAERAGNKRRWRISRSELASLARSYGMVVIAPGKNGENGENGEMAAEPTPFRRFRQDSRFSGDKDDHTSDESWRTKV